MKVIIQAKWNKALHKIVKITTKRVYYSEYADGSGKIYYDSPKTMKECFIFK